MKKEKAVVKVIKWLIVLVLIALGVAGLIVKMNAGTPLLFLAALMIMPVRFNRELWGEDKSGRPVKIIILLFLIIYGFICTASAHALKMRTDALNELAVKYEALIQKYDGQAENIEQTDVAAPDTDQFVSGTDDFILSGSDCTYILNVKTGKFHHEWCDSVGQIKEKNKETIVATREQMLSQGYMPCGECCP